MEGGDLISENIASYGIGFGFAGEYCVVSHVNGHPPTVAVRVWRLRIHRDTAYVLQLPSFLKSTVTDEADMGARPHWLALYSSFCELVVSRESRVRELVQVLLKLIGLELGLEKESLADS